MAPEGSAQAAESPVAGSGRRPQVAQAGEARSFSIPPQALASALDRFADQAGISFAYRTGDISALRSPGVSGMLVPREALQRLLIGTGVIYGFTGATTVTLTKTATSAGAVALGPVTVMGARPAETAYGPVEGYKASRSATATKTDTPIMELPGSVQVVPRQVIEDQGALNLKDVYENVSGVQQAGNTLNAQTEVLRIIRGFESPTLLRNGLRSTQVGAVDLVNVERVEVLKGPASILYGALDPGGVINYVTKRPQAEASHTVQQQVGSYNYLRSILDTTGPVVQDGSLLYRLNAAYTTSESFRDHVDLDRTALAPSFLWQPTDETELLVDFSYLRETQPYDAGLPLSLDGKPLVAKEAFFNDPDLAGRTINDYTASYQLTHKIGPAWRIRNQFQFHRADAENEALRPRGVSPNNQQLLLRYQNENRQDDEAQFLLDATAEFATGAIDHTFLFGSELISQDSDFRRFRQNVPNVLISSNPFVNFNPPANQPREVILGKTRWAGFYAQDQVSMLQSGALKLLFGGRYDIVQTESQTDGVSAPDAKDKAFSGRAGLLYEFSKQFSAYTSVSQSFIPQNPGTIDVAGAPLKPEEGLQYEVGIKGSFLQQRLLATASIFQIEKTNVAVFDQARFNVTGQFSFFPGVEERSRGFEFDVTGAVTEQIQVIGNYAFVDTEVLKNPGDPTSVGGPLGGVPEHKARLWMTYNLREGSPLNGFGFGGGVRYVGGSSAQFATAVKLDPYTVVDAGAWYKLNRLKFGLNLYNLFDQEYIVWASDRSIAHPGLPLSVIGSVALTF